MDSNTFSKSKGFALGIFSAFDLEGSFLKNVGFRNLRRPEDNINHLEQH
jgi:hypothetical protein